MGYYKQLIFFGNSQDYNIVIPKSETQKSSARFRPASVANSVDSTGWICYNGGR